MDELKELVALTPEQIVEEKMPRVFGLLYEPWDTKLGTYPNELLTQFYDAEDGTFAGKNGDRLLYVVGGNWSVCLGMVSQNRDDVTFEVTSGLFKTELPTDMHPFEIVENTDDPDDKSQIGETVWIKLFRYDDETHAALDAQSRASDFPA